jgi:hypothetical protein
MAPVIVPITWIVDRLPPRGGCVGPQWLPMTPVAGLSCGAYLARYLALTRAALTTHSPYSPLPLGFSKQFLSLVETDVN